MSTIDEALEKLHKAKDEFNNQLVEVTRRHVYVEVTVSVEPHPMHEINIPLVRVKHG